MRRHGWRWILGSAVLLAAVLMAVAWIAWPRIERSRAMASLRSADAGARSAAVAYVAEAARSDPTIVREAAAQFEDSDDRAFADAARSLEAAGVWTAAAVPLDAWLRWLSVLARDDSVEERLRAALHLGELPEHAGDGQALDALALLTRDADANVREQAVAAAAAAAVSSDRRGDLVELLAAATRDADPGIARRSWILLGLLRTLGSAAPDWLHAEPEVAEAMLWASVQADPGKPTAALDALLSAASTPGMRASAAYALSSSATDAARQAILRLASTPTELLAQSNQLAIWRALLALPDPDLTRNPLTPVDDAFLTWSMDDTRNPLGEPLSLAAVYRLGIAGARRPTSDDAAYDFLLKLATVEGQRPPYVMQWPLTGHKAPLLRAQTLAISALPPYLDEADPLEPANAIMPAMASDDPPLRDIAAVVAATRFDVERQRLLVRRGLLGDDANVRDSAAMLAGLTGLRVAGAIDGREVDLLEHVAANAGSTSGRIVPRLALWMQNRLDLNDDELRRLLADDKAPRTTLLLAMMHRGRTRDALDWLLAPRGEPPLDLIDLLDRRRWWHVLAGSLPPDAPPFWTWGDAALKRFQIAVLRDWHLVRGRDAGAHTYGARR